MVTFRNNNNRRPPFRNNNNRRPPFRNNNEGSKFQSNDNFKRSTPGRNNHNATKLIEKYNDLAREALANEDKILSENYFQHADHFTRVQNEQESLRMAKINSSPPTVVKAVETEINNKEIVESENDLIKKDNPESAVKKVVKTAEKKLVDKKSVSI
jgi:hypothetical protein